MYLKRITINNECYLYFKKITLKTKQNSYCMVLSDKVPADKQSLKSAIMGVVVLLALGGGGSAVISEVTGVDIETLCQTDLDTGEEKCVDNDDAKSFVSEIFSWIGIIVAGVAFAGLIMAGLKY